MISGLPYAEQMAEQIGAVACFAEPFDLGEFSELLRAIAVRARAAADRR